MQAPSFTSTSGSYGDDWFMGLIRAALASQCKDAVRPPDAPAPPDRLLIDYDPDGCLISREVGMEGAIYEKLLRLRLPSPWRVGGVTRATSKNAAASHFNAQWRRAFTHLMALLPLREFGYTVHDSGVEASLVDKLAKEAPVWVLAEREIKSMTADLPLGYVLLTELGTWPTADVGNLIHYLGEEEARAILYRATRQHSDKPPAEQIKAFPARTVNLKVNDLAISPTYYAYGILANLGEQLSEIQGMLPSADRELNFFS